MSLARGCLMRTTTIRSDVKNLLFDYLLHQLGCGNVALQVRLLATITGIY